MAPRAYWKGFLRLSLVTCPIALFPATSESEKISFNQINRNTGHRIKYQKVDADTGEEFPTRISSRDTRSIPTHTLRFPRKNSKTFRLNRRARLRLTSSFPGRKSTICISFAL